MTLWYMLIVNTYPEYDFVRKRIKPRYKIGLPRLYHYHSRLHVMGEPEIRPIRELYCRTNEEVEDLEENNKSQDLLSYRLNSPLKLRSAYSEVCREFFQYIRAGSVPPPRTPYKLMPEESKSRPALPERFHGIELAEVKSTLDPEKLRDYSLESPYSHWAEMVMKCDFVFYGDDGDSLVPVQEYEIPEPVAILAAGGICPNKLVPSDHLPVAVQFYLMSA